MMGSKLEIRGLTAGQLDGVIDGVIAARESIDLTIRPPRNTSWSDQAYTFEVQDSDGNVLATCNPAVADSGYLTATLDANTTELVNHFTGNPGETKAVWLILWGATASDLYLQKEDTAYYNSYNGTDPTRVYADLDASGEPNGTIIQVLSDVWAKVTRSAWIGKGINNAVDDATPADTDQFAQADTSGNLASTTWGTIKNLLSDLYCKQSNNLSDLDSAPSARTNLGLGSMATEDNVTEGDLSLSDVTTANASASKHGLLPKGDKQKIDYLTVTQSTDLDTIRQRVNELDASIVLQGDWDASTGSFPGGGSAEKGQTWIVSAAGTVDGVEFNINDRVLAITNDASTSTYTDNWLKLDYTDQVIAVAGETGDITKAALLSAINVEDGADVTDAANVGSAIHGTSADSTPADSDEFAQTSSTGTLAKTKWITIKSKIKAAINSVGLDLADHATAPTANGEIRRDGADVKIYSGGQSRNLSTLTGKILGAYHMVFPDAYTNLSGVGGEWTASGSGTNEYYRTIKTAQPADVLYDGSSATQGTLGSLADHGWAWGDNDSLGYSTLYVRDDSGDPDTLSEGLWQADWWAENAATYSRITAGNMAVKFDSGTDQVIRLQLGQLPADQTTWTITAWVRSADTQTTGTLTMRGKYRYLTDGGNWTVPAAITFQTNTKSITGAWDKMSVSGNVSDLGSISAGDLLEVVLGRDVSADSMAESIELTQPELEWI